MASGNLRAIPETTLTAECTMLGPVKPRRLDKPVAVLLESLVPPDSFYRLMEATLDQSIVQDRA